jgi:hypothetical protein
MKTIAITLTLVAAACSYEGAPIDQPSAAGSPAEQAITQAFPVHDVFIGESWLELSAACMAATYAPEHFTVTRAIADTYYVFTSTNHTIEAIWIGTDTGGQSDPLFGGTLYGKLNTTPRGSQKLTRAYPWALGDSKHMHDLGLVAFMKGPPAGSTVVTQLAKCTLHDSSPDYASMSNAIQGN